MKILVPVKRTVDPNVRVRIRQDGSGIETRNLKTTMNPFCEIAMEAAVQFAEAGVASEVVVVTVGPKECDEVLRQGLAMGAQRAIRIDTDAALQPLIIARLLQVVVEREAPDLVILGKQSVDDDNNQTGQMLAALLDWPQGTFVSAIEPGAGTVTVTREVDAGLERLELDLPAVLTTDLRLNTPRYLSLPNIMKARKIAIEVVPAATFGVDLQSRTRRIACAEPAARGECVMLADAGELLDRLRNEARVIP